MKSFLKIHVKKDFYLLNAQSCNELQEMHSIPSTYRVDTKQIDG